MPIIFHCVYHTYGTNTAAVYYASISGGHGCEFSFVRFCPMPTGIVSNQGIASSAKTIQLSKKGLASKS